MMRKKPKSASRKWSAGLRTPEASRTPPLASEYPSKMVAFTPILGHLENVG